MILAFVQGHLGARAPDEEDVSDLPLVELPADHATNEHATGEHPTGEHPTGMHPTGMLAIVLSGDGGWRDLDQTVARALQDAGVSVVGIDSLRYFWRRKSPSRPRATWRG